MLKKKRKIFFIIIVVVVLLAVIGIIYISKEANKVVDATKDYNATVDQYNSLATEYNAIIQESCVDNIDGMATELGMLNVEDESMRSAIKIVFGANSAEKIIKDSQTIETLVDSINTYNKIAKQIKNPDEDWVQKRLENISVIDEIESVTSENNPDGILGKEGGYKSCIYFSINGLDVSAVPGNTIVEKGTDGGGAIEIYESLEDAEARCEYLQGFDGTILYSGSYALVGTMVVRTSYMLSEEDQLYLTNEIIEAFTMLK